MVCSFSTDGLGNEFRAWGVARRWVRDEIPGPLGSDGEDFPRFFEAHSLRSSSKGAQNFPTNLRSVIPKTNI